MRNSSDKPKDIHIVFPHIQKTAGTTVSMWISRHFHSNETLYEASIWTEMLSLPASILADKRFVRGHFGSKIINVFGPHNGFSPIALLRDPVERVVSHFYHLKHAEDAEPAYAMVKDPSFTLMDFLDCNDTQHLVSNYQAANYSAEIGNMQDINKTAHSLGRNPEMSPINVRNAKDFIDMCEVVGVTEKLNEFVLALSDRFGFFPDLQLQKTRTYRPSSSITADVSKKIRSLNDLDYELYNYVIERIERHQKSIHFSPKPKQNPNTLDKSGIIDWNASMPYYGQGWSSIAFETNANHIWSTQTSSHLYFSLNTNKSSSYSLFFCVRRFVAPVQEACFSVFANGNKLNIKKCFVDGDMRHYVATIPRVEDACLDIEFRVNQLFSFNDINPADSLKDLRGVAISRVILIASDTDDAPGA